MATDYNSVKRVNKPLTAAEMLKHEYYQMPKYLIKDPHCKKLSAQAKILFTLINDRGRMSVSARNKPRWVNEKGEVYVIYKREDMADDLGMDNKNIKRVVNELIDIGLIKEERLGLNKCNRVYILPPDYGVSEVSGPVTVTGLDIGENAFLHWSKNECIKTTLTKKSGSENTLEKDAATPHQKTLPRAPSGESEKCANGKYGQVQLTAIEYDELVSVHGQGKIDQYIAELDEYIASKGERYKDHFATVNRWIRRANEEAAEKKTREEERNKPRSNSPGNYKPRSGRDYAELERKEREYIIRTAGGDKKQKKNKNGGESE